MMNLLPMTERVHLRGEPVIPLMCGVPSLTIGLVLLLLLPSCLTNTPDVHLNSTTLGGTPFVTLLFLRRWCLACCGPAFGLVPWVSTLPVASDRTAAPPCPSPARQPAR
jgi:hypothetical protein